MRLLTWNIRHGGNAKRFEDLVQAIQAHDADIIVLTEFRRKSDIPLETELRELGWTWVATTNPPAGTNGILIASRFEMQCVSHDPVAPCPPERWLEVRFPSLDLAVSGIHIPGAGDKWDKLSYWRQLVTIANARASGHHVLVGDFNTGRKIDAEGTPFKYAEYMDELEAQGWVDAFRVQNPEAREFTWYSTAGNGFRLDYAYLSKALASYLVLARHSQAERLVKLSDHAPLVVDLDVSSLASAATTAQLCTG